MTLAEKYRPETLTDITGQENLQAVFRKLTTQPVSVIFYGPPGCGKTTAARIIAQATGLPWHYLNATTASVTEIKKLPKPCLLFLDEIQYFNKKQQQTLLPYMETGEIILIGATTENPWHNLNQTLLSRAKVITFKGVDAVSMESRLKEIAEQEGIQLEAEALKELSIRSRGDMRLALNTMEFAALQYRPITLQVIQDSLPHGMSLTETELHQLKSALQKSIRGSDPDAAIFYLMRLLEGGAIEETCRRLLICFAEDIGCASPSLMATAYAAVQTALQTGMPEARFPLSFLTTVLAVSPKSDSAGKAYASAKEKAEQGYGQIIPSHISQAHSDTYINPHQYADHWCSQSYLPTDLTGMKFYKPQRNNKMERAMEQYWQKIKQEH